MMLNDLNRTFTNAIVDIPAAAIKTNPRSDEVTIVE
jgi:hypothetical protein